MTRWEVVREWNKVIAGWEAEEALAEDGVPLKEAQIMAERFYALTLDERLREAGLLS